MKKLWMATLGILLISGVAWAGSYTITIDDMQSSDSDKLVVDESGDVGINTSLPQSLLDVQGAAGAAGIATLATKETTIVATDELGRINFNAPLEASGTDAILPGASIWSVAEDTFAADNNKTSLVFATGGSEAAAEKMRIDSAGVVTIGGEQVATVPSVNTKMPSQAVELTAAASGSSGIVVADDSDIDFGTGDFTLVWRGSLPDWTPADATLIYDKGYSDAAGFGLMIRGTAQSSFIGLALNGGATTQSSTVAPSAIDGTVHEIICSIKNKVGAVNGEVVFYVDGKQLGSAVAVTSAYTTVSNAEPIYLLGSHDVRTASRTEAAYTFNYALSAEQVADLYKNGVSFADKDGSQTAVYTSDFSAGTDSWLDTRVTLTGNIDTIGGQDDNLRMYASALDSTHGTNKAFPAALVGKMTRVTFDYYIPSTNATVKKITYWPGSVLSNVYGTTLDAWTPFSYEFTGRAGTDYIIQASATLTSFVGANSITDDLTYIRNIVYTEIGATLALEPENIQSAPGQWLDATTNNLHAWMPEEGSSLVRPKYTFQIQGENSWTASEEPQSIAWSTDASQAILPPNCFIEKIIGTVSGADVEDIIIGDGSDDNRFVEVTTGLAAGTTSFTIANPTSDGTNYEMVVDPDAEATMTIKWTIHGIILED